MGDTEIPIVSKLRLDRDSLASDLQGARSQMTEFVQELSTKRITIPLTVDLTDVSAKLNAWRMEQESRPLRIPVEMVQAGAGVASGGGWGGRLSSIMPGSGGDEIYNGGAGLGFGGGPGNIYNTVNQTYNSVTTAAAEYSGPLASPNPNLVPDMLAARLRSGGAAIGGMSGTRLMGGMMGRMMLMEAARAPIEHAAGEYEAWQKYQQANAMGSAQDSRRALIASLQADSSGVTGWLTDALGGTDYRGQAQALLRDEGVENAGTMVLRSQRSTAIMGLRGQAADSADPYERRGLDRQAAYQQAIGAASDRFREQSNAANFAGRRQAAQAEFDQAMVDAAKMTQNNFGTGSGAVSGDTLAAEQANRARAEAIAQQTYDARLKQINREQDALYNEETTARVTAGKILSAGEREDAANQSVRSIDSGLRVSLGNIGAGEALSRATGGGAGASDQAYADRINAQVKALRDKADALEKVDSAQAKQMRTEASAMQQNLASELKARKYARQAEADAGTMSLQDMASRNRSTGMRLAGDTLGASREDIDREANDRKKSLAEARNSGRLTDEGYARGMQEVDNWAALENQKADRDNRQRNFRLDSAIDESAIISPYGRARRRIVDQIEEQRMANPGHDRQYDQLRDNEMRNLDREHAQSLSLMRSGAQATNLRAQGRTYEANNLELGAREQAELDNNAGDTDAQDAIRQKYQAQRNLMNMPHFSQTDSRSVYMDAVKAALMSGYTNQMNAAMKANPGAGHPADPQRPAGQGFGGGMASAGSGMGPITGRFGEAVDKFYDLMQNAQQIYTTGTA